MDRIKYNLAKDGFCFLPKIFSSYQVECARNALWDVIQGQYETGVQPENRFWNVGDDPKSIIKIDKPHLCNEQIWNLITDVDFGKWLADAVGAKRIQVWHSQSVWKPEGGGQKVMRGGTVILNIGPFGNQMVYSPPGLRFRMLLKNRVLFAIYAVPINGKI